jgi:hypothetical protein
MTTTRDFQFASKLSPRGRPGAAPNLTPRPSAANRSTKVSLAAPREANYFRQAAI